MTQQPTFHTDTALARGLRAFFQKLEQSLALTRPVDVYLAGGMATHLYVALRVTADVDIEFAERVLLPPSLAVPVRLEDGTEHAIYLDTNYNTSFALTHEDYREDALPIDMGTTFLRVHVLSPVDLVLSKVSRYAEVDREDIEAILRTRLTTAPEIEKRAREALPAYVGSPQGVVANIRQVLGRANEISLSSKEQPRDNKGRGNTGRGR